MKPPATTCTYDGATSNLPAPWNPQSWNRYAYVGNQPLEYTDPLGLFRVTPPPGCFYDPDQDEQYCFPPDPGPPNPGPSGPGGGQMVQPPYKPPPPKQPQCEYANNFVQRLGIAALGWLARETGWTIGLGAAGSVGSGVGIGASVSVSRQVVVSPSGRAAFVTSYGFALTPLGYVFGSGALGGFQFSISGATDPSQLAGITGDFSITGAAEFGGGVDYTPGTNWQLSGTVGVGGGGFGGAGAPIITSVTPICGSGS